MTKKLFFTEKDLVAKVIARYHLLCISLAIENPERDIGEELISSFHNDLTRLALLQNNARLEKSITGQRGTLQIIAITDRQCSLIGKLISRLFG